MATFIVVLVAVIFIVSLVMFMDKLAKEADAKEADAKEADAKEADAKEADAKEALDKLPAPEPAPQAVPEPAPQAVPETINNNVAKQATKKTPAVKKSTNKVAADAAREPQPKRGRKKAK